MIKKILKSSLFRSSGIYTAANIINSSIPFFLLPILTVYLTPSEYGIVSMFGVLLGFVVPFMGVNVHGAISRKYYDEDSDFNKYISTSLYLLLMASSVVIIIMIIFSDFIAKITSFPEEYLLIVAVAGLGNSIIQINLTLWRVKEKPWQFGIFQISQTIFNLSLSLVFVVGLNLGWFGRVGGQVIAIIVFCIIGMYIIIKSEKLTFKWDKGYANDILKYGIPLIPHALGAFIITMSDRVFITNMIGISETGVYTVGYQIGMIIQLLQDSFNKAWIPYLFKNLKLNNLKVKYNLVEITYLYFIVILGLTVLLSIAAPFIVAIFIGESFEGSIQYILWISLGFAFNGMYKMVSGVIFYEKKTQILSMVTFATAFINIILNYFFIKLNGAVGAAQATSLSFFISFIFTWILSNKVHAMPWNIIKVIKQKKTNNKT